MGERLLLSFAEKQSPFRGNRKIYFGSCGDLFRKEQLKMIEIQTKEIRDCNIDLPGSKSYTHRLLIAAALADGVSVIRKPLRSEDTLLTMAALRQMGITIEDHGERVVVHGGGGLLKPSAESIYLANSGTSMRLLMGVAALGAGPYELTGTDRMAERPVTDLLDALSQIGVTAESVRNTGCPPLRIDGGNIPGGKISIDCSVSSQYLSALLLMAPYTKDGLEIEVRELVSRPYVELTLDIMERLGVKVARKGYEWFKVSGGQVYAAGDYTVEPDCSQASYFWAAAAVTGKRIKVMDISEKSRQGDVRFARVLEKMGCTVFPEEDGIAVQGPALHGVTVDMSDMPDVVPTLAVVAAFAEGETRVTNVAHLREKECDRLGCVAAELNRMGGAAIATETGLVIQGGGLKGAQIATYDDHRMAMCFAVAGLVVPGVVIENESCVEKSFPEYWKVFDTLYQK